MLRAQADLIMIRARAGLVRARTALVNAARGLTKSYGGKKTIFQNVVSAVPGSRAAKRQTRINTRESHTAQAALNR
jgi:hypothetical protein